MAQWDVYVNPNLRARAELPLLVVLQSDLLGSLMTRFVAPLARSDGAPAGLPARLAPVFQIDGQSLVLLPQEAGALDARLLRLPVASLRGESHRIVDAFDALLSGI
jgi:toxin CcdB